jgi:hypothetical protein
MLKDKMQALAHAIELDILPKEGTPDEYRYYVKACDAAAAAEAEGDEA